MIEQKLLRVNHCPDDILVGLSFAGRGVRGRFYAVFNVAFSCRQFALIWLPDQTQDQLVADYLNTNASALFIDEVLGGAELKLKFNDPNKDSRTPDVIVQPQYGVIYTGSSAKNAEHGGMSFGDTNVGLIVSNPSIKAKTLKTPVATSQVAPTLLQFLGIDPQRLMSVRVEKTEVLPQ